MELIRNMIKNTRPNIKDTSLDTYTKTIYKLHKHFNTDKDVNNFLFIKDYDKMMEYLYEKYKDTTVKNILVAIIAFLENDNSDDINILKMKYQNEMEKLRTKIDDNITDNLKSEKQKANWATKKELYSVIKTLKNIAEPLLDKEEPTKKELDIIQQYIFSILYSGKDIKPLRNDYANMKIVRDGYIADIDLDYNYLVLGKKPYFLINEYKTSKRYGSIKLFITTKQLKDVLVKYVKLLGDEQEYLFLNHSNKTPITENGLTKYIQKIYQKYLNKSIGPSMLRTIYISNTDFNKMSYKQKTKMAMEMGHSFDIQQKNYLKIE